MLRPKHISSYSLIIEEGTPYFDMYGKENGESLLKLPDEDTERNMYYLTNELLKKAGYERYEISNYSKPGFESKHNKSYWQRKEYLGFGASAASYIENERYTSIFNGVEWFLILCFIDIYNLNFVVCCYLPHRYKRRLRRFRLSEEDLIVRVVIY